VKESPLLAQDIIDGTWTSAKAFDVPQFQSAREVARVLGYKSPAAVTNAFARGALRAAAYVDETPVFNEEVVVEWRLNRYKRRRNKFGDAV